MSKLFYNAPAQHHKNSSRENSVKTVSNTGILFILHKDISSDMINCLIELLLNQLYMVWLTLPVGGGAGLKLQSKWTRKLETEYRELDYCCHFYPQVMACCSADALGSEFMFSTF